MKYFMPVFLLTCFLLNCKIQSRGKASTSLNENNFDSSCLKKSLPNISFKDYGKIYPALDGMINKCDSIVYEGVGNFDVLDTVLRGEKFVLHANFCNYGYTFELQQDIYIALLVFDKIPESLKKKIFILVDAFNRGFVKKGEEDTWTDVFRNGGIFASGSQYYLWVQYLSMEEGVDIMILNEDKLYALRPIHTLKDNSAERTLLNQYLYQPRGWVKETSTIGFIVGQDTTFNFMDNELPPLEIIKYCEAMLKK